MPDSKEEPEQASAKVKKEAPAVVNGEGWVVVHNSETGGYTEIVDDPDNVEDYASRGWKVAARYTDPSKA